VKPWQGSSQWSFRKTGTMGTLASQAEIGVWVQASGTFLLLRESWGMTPLPRKKFEIVYAKSCKLVHFGPKWLAMLSTMRS